MRLSGGAANEDAALSLGGDMGTAAGAFIVDGTPGNLFADVDADESSAGSTRYRCFYVKNAHVTDSFEDVVVWISVLTESEDTEFDIGLDPAGVSGGATTVVDEETAPAGVTFSRPTTYADGLFIGDMPAGESQAIWVMRTVDPAADALAVDAGVITFSGTSV